jgi:hypothetical protein
MSVKLKIKVTKEVIERAKYCGHETDVVKAMTNNITENCAIALAIRDIFPTATVGNDGIWILNKAHEKPEIKLPLIAQSFIDKFDTATVAGREKLSPIEFTINIPEKVINTINIDEVKKILATSTTLELL